MDLHAWITQQVDAVEVEAHARLKGLRVAFNSHDDGPAIVGTVTEATRTAEGLQLDVARYGAEPVADAWSNVPTVAAVLRRCEADRRILARHRLDPDITYEPACKGCGTYGDQELSNVDNLNECPELLDLAHAHGITPEILAGLDRPQPPERKPRIHNARSLADVLGIATPPITTSDVPEALRGPR